MYKFFVWPLQLVCSRLPSVGRRAGVQLLHAPGVTSTGPTMTNVYDWLRSEPDGSSAAMQSTWLSVYPSGGPKPWAPAVADLC